MHVGLNLIDLNALAGRSDGDLTRAIDEVLDAVAGTFEQRLLRRDEPARPGLLGSIDRSIERLAIVGDSDPRQGGFAALVGLRRNLFPGAPGYQRRAA